MTPSEFIHKWRHVQLTERSAAQQHFLDLCELVGHPKPAEVDKTGDTFTFERGAAKHGGGEGDTPRAQPRGWADVWKKGYRGMSLGRRPLRRHQTLSSRPHPPEQRRMATRTP